MRFGFQLGVGRLAAVQLSEPLAVLVCVLATQQWVLAATAAQQGEELGAIHDQRLLM
jgi:hypothetical protein